MRFVFGASCLKDKLSTGRVAIGRFAHGTSCSWCEMFDRWVVNEKNCPWNELFTERAVHEMSFSLAGLPKARVVYGVSCFYRWGLGLIGTGWVVMERVVRGKCCLRANYLAFKKMLSVGSVVLGRIIRHSKSVVRWKRCLRANYLAFKKMLSVGRVVLGRIIRHSKRCCPSVALP
jgi:hypothetical protein